MTAKQYLMQLRNIDVIIRQKDEQLREAYSDAVKISQRYDLPKVSTSNSSDLSDAVILITEAQEKLAKIIAEKYRLRAKIIAEISAMEDERYRHVLEAYYVNGMTWEQTAVMIGYDYSWTLKLHGMALQEFERLYLKTNRSVLSKKP